MTNLPPVDPARARAVRAIFDAFSPPYLGDVEHQPALVFRSSSTSRVVCTCGEELGVVSTSDGMARVIELHRRHAAAIAS